MLISILASDKEVYVTEGMHLSKKSHVIDGVCLSGHLICIQNCLKNRVIDGTCLFVWLLVHLSGNTYKNFM